MEVLIKKLVLVLLLGVSLFLSSLSFADESSVEFDYQTIRGQYRAAGGTYYPRVVGIPSDMYDTIEEGIQQRALANSEIQRILYSGSDADRAQLMRQLPELKVFLGINDQGRLSEKRGYHAGFVSELMGKVH
ncbi:MAG: hypothetical protein KDD50_14145, partial [Bdellovibrionales bacterium]|nr:hypothetical protein [Bdellovibrionales bacterium]